MIIDKVKADIEEFGWHFLYVFDPEQEHANFGYTIGLEETYNHPEIIVFGLKKETIHGILTDLVEKIEIGTTFGTDEKLKDLIANDFKVLFKPVVGSGFDDYLGQAVKYYNKPFRALVLFWPDKNNILPTEQGCEVDVQDEALKIV